MNAQKTKADMISEVFASMRWTAAKKEANTRYAMKFPYESIKNIYEAFLKDKDHTKFYVALLLH